MDIMKYAEMFQSMRQKTMVEMNEMIAHVVSQVGGLYVHVLFVLIAVH
jgi:hypothetical protein